MILRRNTGISCSNSALKSLKRWIEKTNVKSRHLQDTKKVWQEKHFWWFLICLKKQLHNSKHRQQRKKPTAKNKQKTLANDLILNFSQIIFWFLFYYTNLFHDFYFCYINWSNSLCVYECKCTLTRLYPYCNTVLSVLTK